MANDGSSSKGLEESRPTKSDGTEDVTMMSSSKDSAASDGIERKSKRRIVTLPISGKV